MSGIARNQIQGWKEIAAYLGRDERTAKRWEKYRGMPVRRIPGSGRANVYIVVADLEAWLAEDSAQPRDSAVSQLKSPVQPFQPDLDSSPSTPVVLTTSQPQSHPVLPVRLTRGSLAMLSVAAISVIALAAYALRSPLRSRLDSHSTSQTAASAHPVYRSPVPGLDDLYLQGKFFLEERTPASLEAARAAFTEVTARDRSYALAFAGLAATYLLLREYASMSEPQAYESARAAAERALTLDPSLADAHASLGFINFFADWNPDLATSHFQKAIQLNPDCVLAHHWYGSMLTHQARFPEAVAELNIAQRLAPASTSIVASRAFALGLGGQRDAAIGILKSVIGTTPQEAPPHRALANLSLLDPHDIPQFIEQVRQFAAIRHNAGDAEFAAHSSIAFRHGGEYAFWLEMRRHGASPGEHHQYMLAQADAQLGMFDEAFQNLNFIADRRDLSLTGVLIDPTLRPLRKDPRFRALVQRVGAFDPPRLEIKSAGFLSFASAPIPAA